MNVTVAVIPRERFRPLPSSLRSLFKTIDVSVPVVVVDGGAPEHVRQELRVLKAERPFELVENESFVLPNKARNIALDRVKTKYVAFCDNDLDYWPGWLDRLVENAEINGSIAVSPLIFIGPSNPPIIHHAGGSHRLRKDGAGRIEFHEQHRYDGIRLPKAEAEKFERASLDHANFEYHCVLIDAEAMRSIGGHDERLILHEHVETSLRLLMEGGRLTFEPKARVMYRAFDRFADEDWPYFLYRWALRRADTSTDIFAGNWGARPWTSALWVRMHQDHAMLTALPRLPKSLNTRAVKRLLLKLYRPRILWLDPRIPDDAGALIPPKPPADGLKRVGLELP